MLHRMADLPTGRPARYYSSQSHRNTEHPGNDTLEYLTIPKPEEYSGRRSTNYKCRRDRDRDMHNAFDVARRCRENCCSA
jgi:hypothetical protein